MTTLRVLVALVVLTAPVSATGVIAFRTADRVVLAADSALTGFDRDGEVVSVEAGCKIGRTGAWSYVWGGHRDGGTKTNLVAPFEDQIGQAGTLPDLTVAVREFISSHINTLDWDTLRTVYPVGSVVFWTGIGRVSDDAPELGIYRAHVARHEPLELEVVSATCPGDCAAGWLAAGHAAEVGPIAERLSTEPQPAWLARLDGPAAHRLLTEQADATPDRIRPPFDVLALTGDGARWINRHPDSSCPAHLEGVTP